MLIGLLNATVGTHSGLFDILLNSIFNVFCEHKDEHMRILATIMIYDLPVRKLSY